MFDPEIFRANGTVRIMSLQLLNSQQTSQLIIENRNQSSPKSTDTKLNQCMTQKEAFVKQNQMSFNGDYSTQVKCRESIVLSSIQNQSDQETSRTNNKKFQILKKTKVDHHLESSYLNELHQNIPFFYQNDQQSSQLSGWMQRGCAPRNSPAKPRASEMMAQRGSQQIRQIKQIVLKTLSNQQNNNNPQRIQYLGFVFDRLQSIIQQVEAQLCLQENLKNLQIEKKDRLKLTKVIELNAHYNQQKEQKGHAIHTRSSKGRLYSQKAERYESPMSKSRSSYIEVLYKNSCQNSRQGDVQQIQLQQRGYATVNQQSSVLSRYPSSKLVTINLHIDSSNSNNNNNRTSKIKIVSKKVNQSAFTQVYKTGNKSRSKSKGILVTHNKSRSKKTTSRSKDKKILVTKAYIPSNQLSLDLNNQQNSHSSTTLNKSIHPRNARNKFIFGQINGMSTSHRKYLSTEYYCSPTKNGDLGCYTQRIERKAAWQKQEKTYLHPSKSSSFINPTAFYHEKRICRNR